MSSEEESLDGEYLPDSGPEELAEDEEQEELGLDADYVALFQAHVEETKAHLRGAVSSSRLMSSSARSPADSRAELHIANDRANELVVDEETDSHWTEDEKNIFFHGLSVYSRWRPDLIAQPIVSKSVTDVCVYIDRLEEALESCEDEDFIDDDDDVESLLEASEPQVAQEEHQAMLYAALELESTEQAKQNERKRKLGCLGDQRAGEESTSKRRKEDTSSIELAWRIQDAFEHLDEWMLRRMAYILRNLEDGTENAEEEVQVDEPASGRPVITDDHIDPVLLALSQSPFLILPPFHRSSSTPDIAPSLPPSSAAPSEYGDELDQTQEHDNLTPAEVLLSLSPRSRRRYKKMLHMRRKRGDTNMGLGLSKRGRKAKFRVPAVRGRGRPRTRGRNGSRGYSDDNTEEIDVDEQDGQEDDDDDDYDDDLARPPPLELPDCMDPLLGSSPSPEGEVKEYRHIKQSGLTPPYKAQKLLDELNVNVDTLVDNGFSLFHLAKFSEIINLAYNIHSPIFSSSPFGPSIGISGPTIRLLEAFVVDFVESVVKKAITNRERELALKKSKVWGVSDDLADEVKTRNVHNALTALGISDEDRKKAPFFERVIEEMKKKIRLARSMGDSGSTDEEEDFQEDERPQNEAETRISSLRASSSRSSFRPSPTPSSSLSSSPSKPASPMLQVPNLHPLPMCVAALMNLKRSLSYSEPLISAVVEDEDDGLMSLDSGDEDSDEEDTDADEGDQFGVDEDGFDLIDDDSDGLASDDGS